MRTIFILITAILSSAALAQVDALPATERVNGMETTRAFTAAIASMRASVLTLHNPGERDPMAMATLVAPGIAVAKASDLEGKSSFEARDERRRTIKVSLDRVDEPSDLAVLKVEWEGGKPINWADDAPQLGKWVVATTPRIGMVRVGLNAANMRPIDSRGASLGAMLEDAPKKKKGCLVGDVIPDAAAQKGGMEKEDIIVKAGDKAITKREDLSEYLKAKKPGEVVKFEVLRKGKSVKLDVTLDSPSDVLDKMNRNQQMSGRTSRRKDPFPMILQTDIPVPPESMGSPLLNLDGLAIGILISRTDRVTTYALPKDVVLKVLEGVAKE
ncbi:MAG: PDZ domain-containing protein [Verrucomicrobiales bacterium]